MNTMLRKLVGCVGLVMSLALAAQAGQYWWSGNGTTFGGSGTWNTTSGTNWGSSISGPFDVAWPNGGNDTAIFTNTALVTSTVTLSEQINVTNITFFTSYTNCYTLTGGTLNVGSGASGFSSTLGGNNGGTPKINSPIVGSGTLTISGGNAPYGNGIFLSANNGAFTGKLVVNKTFGNYNGVAITNDNALGAVPASYTPDAVTLQNGAFLHNNGSGVITIPANRGITITSGTFHGAGGGSFVLNCPVVGSGNFNARDVKLVLNNTNGFAGDTAPNNSTLIMGVDNALPHGTGKGNINFNDGNGASTVNLNGHTLAINGLSGTIASSKIDNTNASPVTLVVGDNNATASFAGIITNSNGALLLTKIGTGTQTLQGKLSYTGGTSVNGGTLVIDKGVNTSGTLSALSLGGGTLSLYGGGVTTNSTQTFGNVMLESGASGVIVTNRGGNSTLTLGNTWTRESGATLAMTLLPGAGTSILASSPSLQNGIMGGYAAVIDANGVNFATTNNSGQIVSYTSQTVLTAAVAGGALDGTVNYVVTNGVTLSGGLAGSTQTVNSLLMKVAANPVINQNGRILVVGAGGIIYTNAAWGRISYNGDKMTSGTNDLVITVYGAGGADIGNIVDNGSSKVGLTKTGPGSLLINAGNTYSGDTVVNQGQLQRPEAIPFGAGKGNLIINSGGSCGIGTTPAAINGLASATNNLGGSFNAFSGNTADTTLTVGNNDASASFPGTITDAGTYKLGFIKVGSGTQTLSGANTYRGGTILSNGVLNVSSTNNIGGANAKVIFAGGTLRINGTAFNSFGATPLTFTSLGGGLDIADAGNSFTLTNNLATGTVLTKIGAGMLTLTGTQAGTINTDDSSKISFGSGLGFYNLGILAGGVLSPAGTNAVATLAVNNNLTLSGKLLVDVTSSTSDSVTAGGTITLSGATLEIVNSLLLNRSQPYTLLTAGVGAVSGSLAPLNLPALWKLKAVGNTVVLYYSSGTLISFM